MTVTISPITPTFAAEVGDVDLSRPLGNDDLAAIKQAFWKYSVLIFPDQHLSAEQHLDFARQFGPHEETIAQYRPGTKLRVRPEIADVSNLDHEGRLLPSDSTKRLHELGNRLWHTDSSFKRVPALASLLYARSIPPVGGLTEFADECSAYDALPETMKQRLEGMLAEHCIRYSRARIGFTDFSAEERESMPPVLQPLVRTIPETGRKTLYLASHAGRIPGVPDDEADKLIDQLIEHATQRQFVYIHRWRVNDLVMWDNRCTMHRGTAFDDTRIPRDVQRATVSDVAQTGE
jgi:alpha-ketoglutarate-dependent 2,4-dichlorophenoxyacetate dioxygenase